MVYLDPTSDIAFKKLFGSQEHKNVTISFLNSVLERPEGKKIVDLVITDPNNLPETLESKSSIVDVRCTDQRGEQYIIEMQVVKQKDYAARCQYYSALALSRQLKHKEKFYKLTPVIFVGILDFNMLKTTSFMSHHLLLDTKTGEHALTCLEFHFIELKKFKKKLDALTTSLDKWIYLLKNAITIDKVPASLKKPAALEEAFDILAQSNWTTKELEAYERVIDSERSLESQIETAYEDGLDQRSKEIAMKLLAMKMSADEIAKITGLSIEEIKKLK